MGAEGKRSFQRHASQIVWAGRPRLTMQGKGNGVCVILLDRCGFPGRPIACTGGGAVG